MYTALRFSPRNHTPLSTEYFQVELRNKVHSLHLTLFQMAFDYSVPDKIASRAKDNTTTLTKESLESVGSQIEFNKGYE